jgi:hypothetical protein
MENDAFESDTECADSSQTALPVVEQWCVVNVPFVEIMRIRAI